MTMQPEPPAPVTPPNAQALYGWIIVGITFLATALVIGSRFSLGLFLTDLPEAFDTSPAAVSGALAISMLGAAALQPVTGYLLDAWGGRIVIAIGLGAGGIALCGTAVADSLWQLVAFMGLLSSVAYAAVSPVSATSIVASWFERRRGVALGIATSGTKVAMVTLPPLLMLLITLQGWRSATLALGLTLCLLVPLVLLLLRPAPGHIRTTRRPKQAAAEGAPTPPPGMSYRDALRQPAFWLIAFALCGNGLIMNLVFIHLPTYLMEQGYDEGMAATGLSLLGAMGILGTIATGALSDWMGRRNVLLIMFAARGVTALLVVLFPGPLSMIVFVMAFGLLGYGAIAVIGAYATEFFGKRSIGAILGTAYVFNQVGGAVGTFSGGASLQFTGSYSAALWISIVITLLSFICIVGLRDPRGRAATYPA